MHLVFIRHADPDYAADSVTEKGRRELALLAERMSRFDITEAFVSPMGRAQETAAACFSRMKAPQPKNTTLPWLREFSYPVRWQGKPHIPWDWLPREFFSEKKYMDISTVFDTDAMKCGNIGHYYNEVCDGFDAMLSSYNYKRLDEKTPIYICPPHLTEEEAARDMHLEPLQRDLDPRTLLFVCHLGVMFVMISHLTGISPVQLWQGFFVAPASVTILGAEERVPGEVVFRVQQFGDVSHLLGGGESVSASGFFGSCLSN